MCVQRLGVMSRAITAMLIASPVTAIAQSPDFAREVKPLLERHCTGCHGIDKQEQGLRLDQRAQAFQGGDSGEPGIVPGNSARSEVFHRITHVDENKRMPPEEQPLAANEIAIIREWIDAGAFWPEDGSRITRDTQHWSFQPVGRPTPPAFENPWGSGPIDAFVLDRLRSAGLQPSPQADPVTLIRRVYRDLHGLLPTIEQVQAFSQDPSEQAWEQVVDEVLASPRYGERWAQHWLDVVQYAESHGFEMNLPRPSAYHYRDYVIEAFNRDLPYDQFIFDQLAGDAIGEHAATGFLVASAWDEVKSENPIDLALQRQDELTAMINATGMAFLGLTLGCARCHNHKFDPVSQREFYSLAGVFAGVQHAERAVATEPAGPILQRQAEAEARIASLKAQLSYRRAAIRSDLNEELFDPVLVDAVRLEIHATTEAEPCIDELEVWADGKNVALNAVVQSSGDFLGDVHHQLQHINDGRFGNSYSWISNEPGGGWVQLEFAQPVLIERVVWSRDRTAQYHDRTATEYDVGARELSGNWVIISGSQDRVPLGQEGGRDASQHRVHPLVATIANAQAARRAIKDPDSIMMYAGKMEQPGPTRRLYRGDPAAPREEVVPDTLALLGTLGLSVDTPEQERRAALGRSLGSRANPLTARVMANRIWYHHFGTGIVDTPGDLGVAGGAPSHPILLDWMARRLMESGWSLKSLHRDILLSNVYRQASAPTPEGLARDTDSRLLWRYPPRRLEGEVIRDCILQLSASLDLSMGGPGFSTFKPDDNYVRLYTPKESTEPAEWRRMVYMHKVRLERAPLFGTFDLPDAGQGCPKRSRSTTAIQALNLFNGNFVLRHAERMASRLEGGAPDLSGQIELAYRYTYGRCPSHSEAAQAVAFAGEYGLPAFCRALLNSNELVFIQ